ncbi:AAA family ATPase [Aeromicrobium sp. CTD01-1L150]|uniref:AAA family ATPase n=1 Tax=Aeromicrobium sp. CTD01-1L150 TaxID=3341830 RepID=UPI0035C02AF1
MERLEPDDVLRRALDLLDATREDALLVLGEPGIGKSHLLQQIAGNAGPPTTVVRVRAAESSYPLSGIAAFISSLRGLESADLVRHVTLRSQQPDGLHAAAHDLIALLQGMSFPPTGILIDGVDDLDPDSLALMGTIAAHLGGTGLRLVLTATEPAPAEHFEGMPTVAIGPMSEAAQMQVADEHPSTDRTSARIIAQRSGGNPAVLLAHLDELAPGTAQRPTGLKLPPASSTVHERIASAVLDTLDPASLEILRIASLAPLCHAMALGDLLDGSPHVVEDLVEDGLLVRSGQYIRLADPRVRTFLASTGSARDRRAIHARLARATSSYDASLTVWHESFGRDTTGTVDDLLRASAQLVNDGHTDAAVELAERALRRSHSLDDHTDALVVLCTCLFEHRHLALTARYSTRENTPFSTDQPIALASVRLASQILRDGPAVDDEVRTVVRHHGLDGRDRVDVLLCLAVLHRAESWEVETARDLLTVGRDTEPAHRLTRERLSAAGEILDALDGTPEPTEPVLLPLAPAPGLPTDLLLMRGRALALRGHHQQARDMLAVVINGPDPLWASIATYMSIENELDAGEFRMARIATRAWEQRSPWTLEAHPDEPWIRGWCAYSLGAIDEVHGHVEASLARSTRAGNSGLRARAIALRGAVAMLTGDHDQAVRDLRQVTALSTRFRNPTLLRHWADYVEACARTERHQEADVATRLLEQRVTTHPSRWGELAVARCRAISTQDERSLELFTQAIGMFGPDDSAYELGRTQGALSHRQKQLGDPAASCQTRTQAAATFEQCGAESWARRLGGQPETPQDQSPLGAISTEEQEIVQRLVAGQRTRDIAEALHLSVRAVELRLTRLYRLAGVTSRRDLVEVLNQSARRTDWT